MRKGSATIVGPRDRGGQDGTVAVEDPSPLGRHLHRARDLVGADGRVPRPEKPCTMTSRPAMTTKTRITTTRMMPSRRRADRPGDRTCAGLRGRPGRRRLRTLDSGASRDSGGLRDSPAGRSRRGASSAVRAWRPAPAGRRLEQARPGRARRAAVPDAGRRSRPDPDGGRCRARRRRTAPAGRTAGPPSRCDPQGTAATARRRSDVPPSRTAGASSDG